MPFQDLRKSLNSIIILEQNRLIVFILSTTFSLQFSLKKPLLSTLCMVCSKINLVGRDLITSILVDDSNLSPHSPAQNILYFGDW